MVKSGCFHVHLRVDINRVLTSKVDCFFSSGVAAISKLGFSIDRCTGLLAVCARNKPPGSLLLHGDCNRNWKDLLDLGMD